MIRPYSIEIHLTLINQKYPQIRNFLSIPQPATNSQGTSDFPECILDHCQLERTLFHAALMWMALTSQ